MFFKKRYIISFNNLLHIIILIMETATIIIIFASSLLLGITGYYVFVAFGPNAKNLRDPFEEHED